MRKLFSLFAAMLVALAVNATILDIGPTSPQSGDNIRREIRDHISAGDTLRLANGTYTESQTVVADKNVVILAAEGAKPIVQLAAGAYIKVSTSANVVIKGLTFDGATNSTQYAVRAYDATPTKIKIENCEFYGFVKYIITSSETAHADAVVVDNCYFHNNTGRAAIYFPQSTVENQQTCLSLKVTNSTFANNDASSEYVGIIDVRSYGLTATDDIEVLVDHCTFYNNITMNTDYADVNTRIANKSTVSNCIFAHSEAYERRATYMYAGSAINCLTFNLTKDASQDAHTWMTTRTNCFTADPLFNDLANNKYTFAGNWVTMELSPARGAATDGSDLGDPRWYSAEVLPETDFSTPYVCAPAKAKLSGRVSLKEDSLLWDNNAEAAANGVAKWKIHATKGCFITATINNASNNTGGHCWQVAILDADGNPVGDPVAEAETTWSHKDDLLSGTLLIPEAGDYTIKLSNSTAWSPAKLMGVTLTFDSEIPAPTFTDFEINFMTNPYTATLPTGVSVEGTFHDDQHGYSSPKVTIPVLAGNYKITIGNCQHSNNNGTSIKNADESATLNMIDANGQTITSFLAKANCYHQKPAENITCAWFVADADQTIKVICPQYTPYFKIEKVDEVPAAKTMYTVSFSAGDAQGVAPAAIQVEAGHAITIPVNRSLYKEGKTLFCWTEGANFYATNTSYIPAGDVELTPIFSDNSVELLTATEDVTVKWEFGESNGAPTLALQGSAGLLVTQATIGETKIDVKLDINAASGKFSNAGRGDKWAQVNSGTVFTFPTKENAVVTMEAYTNPADYTVSAGTSTVNDNNYYSYLQVVLPASPATAGTDWCGVNMWHFYGVNADGDPNSYIIFSLIDNEDGTLTFKITNDPTKNTKTFDYLLINPIGVQVGADVAEGGETSISGTYTVPGGAKKLENLEILWSNPGWDGRWMVQNLTIDLENDTFCEKGPDTPTAIDNANVAEKAQKFIENGQLFIELNGVRYNVIGAKVR